MHLWPTSCTGSIHSPAVDWTPLCISSQLAAQATFTCLQSTGPLCTSPANRLHRQHSLTCSQPDLAAHIWPTGCTGSIHSSAVDWPSLHFSSQPAAQAAFTCLQSTGPLCTSPADRLHRQHLLTCSQPDLSAHLLPTGCTGSVHSPAADWTSLCFSGQPAAQAAFTCLQLTRPLCTSPPTGYLGIHSPTANWTTLQEWGQ